MKVRNPKLGRYETILILFLGLGMPMIAAAAVYDAVLDGVAYASALARGAIIVSVSVFVAWLIGYRVFRRFNSLNQQSH